MTSLQLASYSMSFLFFSEQVRLDTSLVSRTLLTDLIHDQINRIYYVLLAMLTDAQIETTSDYWMQFGMTGVSIVYPTTQLVSGITVPLIDFTIQPTTNVVNHWQDLVDEIQVCPVMQLFHNHADKLANC